MIPCGIAIPTSSAGEIISGVAVVVTLLFLILEVRANTAVTRASLYASNLDALNEMQSVVLQDPDLTRVFYDFLQDETANFEEPDRRRLQGLVVMMFRNYEKAYFMNEYDLLGEDEWGRFQRIVCLNHARARSAGIEVVLPFVLTDRFTDYLESSCATRNCVDARCAALLHQAPQRPPKGSVDQIDHRDVDQRNW